MFAAIRFLRRLYTCLFNPPVAPKSGHVLRFGILGAANIAPQALILCAKSHPQVLIAAVAARDVKKAEAFAKKHEIPIVHKTYDDLIADPTIDCIYNPLPNGLHYEWTIKALLAGKHVLLEKPSVSNATEAASLFRHPVLGKPNAPVLLEAFHYRFHPAWRLFLTLFDPKDVQEVRIANRLAAGVFPLDDIRWNYSLSGGTLMDFGTYAVSAMRGVFASEPIAVREAGYRPMPDGFDKKCDQAAYATYEFDNGGIAKIEVDLQARGGYWFPWLTSKWPSLSGMLPTLWVELREKKEGVEGGLEKWTKKKLISHAYLAPAIYNRIDIITTTELRDPKADGKVVSKEEKKEYLKAYKWPGGAEGGKKKLVGEEWWSTYRYQLEAFVDKVKGREGSGAWVDGEDSVRQMEVIDKTYEKMGLPLRPTSASLA
ncbi:oxidoreductase domain-containing protein [Pleomassaria siparia CBS 279.74]|uniref:D-xylose 1-dehydrogenase (NADP(+), D-xylono-1,5-lactone-forming) n=1 Tax=Pleomassaria siparia CBS 279.74 TaxID=1314801 RepID=A0A6G1K9E9_9PLEO|nr:oxidoreductase domain-containing protein [Pleomassaria siparia CBS 279.74]